MNLNNWSQIKQIQESNTNDLFIDNTIPGIPIRELLLVALIVGFFVIILTSVLMNLSYKFGIIPLVRDRDVHAKPVPRIGGISIYLGILLGFIISNRLPALARSFLYSDEITAVLLAGGIILIVGIIDDIWGLDAITKLLGQVIASFILVLFDIGWTVIYVPFFDIGTLILDPYQTALLTILIVVTCINAINFIDGLDGLAAGLSMIIMFSIALFSFGLISRNNDSVNYYPPVIISVVVMGACAGFLFYNFYPAKIFMGDSGAMLLGFCIATTIISVSGKISGTAYGASRSFILLAPIFFVMSILLIPLSDMVMAIIRRTKAGISPFVADKDHLHHRLLRLGHSHKGVVLIIYLWAAIPAFSMALTTFTNWYWGLILLVIGVVIAYLFTFKFGLKLTLKN